MFLKSLSEYQQRAEIGRLAFSERWAGSSLEVDILKDLAVFTFSETLGVDSRFWQFDLKTLCRGARRHWGSSVSRRPMLSPVFVSL